MRAIAIALCLAAIVLLAGCTSFSGSTDQQGMPPTVAMSPEGPTNLDVWMARNAAVLWIECPDGDVRWELTDPHDRMIGIAILDKDWNFVREIDPEPRSWDQTSPPVVTGIWESGRHGDPSGQAVVLDVLMSGETSIQQIRLSRKPGGSWRVKVEPAPGRLRHESGCGLP